jgi:membrane protease YdiL (CAAX protease family)
VHEIGPIVGGLGMTFVVMVMLVVVMGVGVGVAEASPVVSGTTAPPQAAARLPQLKPEQWVMLGMLLGGPAIVVVLFIKGWLRPGGLKAAGVRQLGVHPWWMWLMAALLPLMAIVFGQGLAVTAFGMTDASAESVKGAFIASACSYVPGVVTAVFLARLMHQTAPSAGLAPTKGDGPIGGMGFLLAVPVVVTAAAGAEWIFKQVAERDVPRIAHETLASIAENKDNPWVWGSAALAVLAAPVLEELVYRGFLQSMILRLTGIPGLAVVLTSAVFTWMHWKVVGGIWPPLVPLAVLSLAMGIAFERSKRIGVPIVMHVLFNAGNVALAVWGKGAS